MAYTMIDIDKQKWKVFKLWCINHDTTIKAEIGKFLDKFIKEKNKTVV